MSSQEELISVSPTHSTSQYEFKNSLRQEFYEYLQKTTYKYLVYDETVTDIWLKPLVTTFYTKDSEIKLFIIDNDIEIIDKIKKDIVSHLNEKFPNYYIQIDETKVTLNVNICKKDPTKDDFTFKEYSKNWFNLANIRWLSEVIFNENMDKCNKKGIIYSSEYPIAVISPLWLINISLPLLIGTNKEHKIISFINRCRQAYIFSEFKMEYYPTCENLEGLMVPEDWYHSWFAEFNKSNLFSNFQYRESSIITKEKQLNDKEAYLQNYSHTLKEKEIQFTRLKHDFEIEKNGFSSKKKELDDKLNDISKRESLY